jgi:hypothetical protein
LYTLVIASEDDVITSGFELFPDELDPDTDPEEPELLPPPVVPTPLLLPPEPDELALLQAFCNEAWKELFATTTGLAVTGPFDVSRVTGAPDCTACAAAQS